MKIQQSFEVARPLPAVWSLFQDVPTVAGCMPGVEVTEDKGGGQYAGRIAIRLGPFVASFEGDGTITADPENHRGHVDGRGLDKKGGSRSRLVMDYVLVEAGSGTRVDIDAEVQLAGPIAQFGRTGMITETAQVLIDQFARNVEAHLAASGTEEPESASPSQGGTAPRPVNTISVWRLVAAMISSWFRRLTGGGRPPQA
jgi:uncharacterized protein